MPLTVTVLYPNVSDANFNLDYYLASHMPLVQKEFGKNGMKGYRVAKILGTATGEAAPYSVQCTLEFENNDQFQAALKASSEPILGDIPNFSNKEPTFLVGEVVGTNL